MPTALMPEGRQRFYNNDGTPCAGGKLYTYAAGTTNPKATFADEAGTVPNTNPIELDAKGEALIYWSGAYKVDLKQADGVQVTGWPVDNYKTDPGGVWGLLSQLAASVGAALVGWTNGGTPTTVAKALDILYFGVANVRNPKYAGGAKGGGNDDTAAFKAALAAAKVVYAPADTYRITDSLTLPLDVYLIGDGMKQTVLQSEVIGGSLLRVSSPDGTQVGCVRDVQLLGNNLTGAAGNGHAINFIDPAFGSGAFTPQGMVVERVWIRNFRGVESRDNSAGNKICAAGIICVEGLQNIYRDVLVHYCGHGFYLERTQTNKLENCVAYTCDKAGVFSFQNVALVIEKCDIVGNGASGTTDPGYPSALPMGNVVSGQDETFIFTKNKVKNTNGVAQLYLDTTNGAVVEDNWLRADADAARANVVNHALYAVKCPGIQVNKNTFSHVLAAGTTPAAGKAKLVRFATDYINGVFNGSFKNNVFPTQAGLLTEYNACWEGLVGNTCILSGWEILGNRFGTPVVVGASTVVDVDILVRNAVFSHSRIKNNVHYAQTNVTRTRAISGESLGDERNNDIGDNYFKADGGTISDEYYGFLYPTRRLASSNFDPVSLPAGALTTTNLAVTSALLGEPVQVWFSQPLANIILTGWVSSAGIVTIQFYNPTAAAVDLPAGSVGVIVTRPTVAEIG